MQTNYYFLCLTKNRLFSLCHQPTKPTLLTFFILPQSLIIGELQSSQMKLLLFLFHQMTLTE